MRRKLSAIINVCFETTRQLLIIYCAFAKYLGKNVNTMWIQWTISSALYGLQKIYGSVGRQVLNKILIELGICRILLSLILLNVKYKETKHVIDKQWNMNIIIHQPQNSVFGIILNTRFDQYTNYQVIPSTVSWDIARCFASKMTLITVYTQETEFWVNLCILFYIL